MTFESELAKIYDQIYHDKDYEKEIDFIEEIFRHYFDGRIKTVLDGGCGTGGHIIPLAQRGYQVTGIDISEEMLKSAQEKARNAKVNVTFHVNDIRQHDLKQAFDAYLLMFNVIGYVTRNEEIIQTLKNVKKHLKKDSLFIFDCWNGVSVLRTLPSVRMKTIGDEKNKIIRFAEPELDTFNNILKVNYHVLKCEGNVISNEFRESHVVRYFFPQELMHFLASTGFELLKIGPFMNLNEAVNENTWNITVVARNK